MGVVFHNNKMICHHSMIDTSKSYSYIFLTGNPIWSSIFANNWLESIQIIIAVQIPTISPKFQNIFHYTWYNIGKRMEHLENMNMLPYGPRLHFLFPYKLGKKNNRLPNNHHVFVKLLFTKYKNISNKSCKCWSTDYWANATIFE